MFRRSSNNTFIPPKGLNAGSFAKIGNSTDELGERYPGLLGSTLVLDEGGARKYSDTSVGLLRAGVYQLVKLSASVTRGEIVVWDTTGTNTLANFVVTNAIAMTTGSLKAGVAICSGTSGEYVWIQVSGLATCKYAATAGSTDLGATVVADFANATAADRSRVVALADATTLISINQHKVFVGYAQEAAASNGLKLVALNLAGFYQNIA